MSTSGSSGNQPKQKFFKWNSSAGDHRVGSNATVGRQPSAKKSNGLSKRVSKESVQNGSQTRSDNILNVAEMLLHGVADNEILDVWLTSIQCEEFAPQFIVAGYDMRTLSRITPQDLTAIGVKEPTKRLKILTEIKKLNLQDGLPNFVPASLSHWLSLLRLDSQYYKSLCDQNIDTIEKMCQLTWEDFEELGITKLGHQKRIQLAIERMKEVEAEERSSAATASEPIYDTTPSQMLVVASAEHHCRILTRPSGDRGSRQSYYSASSEDSHEQSLNIYNSSATNYSQTSSGGLKRQSSTTTASSGTPNDTDFIQDRQRPSLFPNPTSESTMITRRSGVTGTTGGSLGTGLAVSSGQDDDFPPPPSPLSLTDSDWLDVVSLNSGSNYSDVVGHGTA